MTADPGIAEVGDARTRLGRIYISGRLEYWPVSVRLTS
jgi:hypothetical protein